jgi:SAM-dependent methyltransferase
VSVTSRARRTDDGYFDEMWATGPDPWDHAGRFYEQRKYALTAGMLARETYESAFEPGCATGILTALLAPRVSRYLATDRHPRAVEVTRARVAALRHVRVEQAPIPAHWPGESFDLVVLSEVLYYLTEDDVRTCLDLAAGSTAPGGELVAVHYRMPVDEHALLGDDVHALIREHQAWELVATHLEEKFVLESFTRR